MNSFAYILYLLITGLITFYIGYLFYRNGRIYILQLLHGDEKLTDFINRLLLVGYFLLNIGYAALMISTWQTLHTLTDVFTSICCMTGSIMLTLALIHFMNMALIFLISQRHHHLSNNKS